MIGFPYPRPPKLPPGNGRGIWHNFLSLRGRIGRVSFLLLTPLVLATALALFVAGLFVGERGLSDTSTVPFALSVLLLVCGFSLTVRRLQDCGWPPLAGAVALLPRVGWLLALWHVDLRTGQLVDVGLILLLLDVMFLLALAFWPGRPGANAYGPEPD